MEARKICPGYDLIYPRETGTGDHQPTPGYTCACLIGESMRLLFQGGLETLLALAGFLAPWKTGRVQSSSGLEARGSGRRNSGWSPPGQGEDRPGIDSRVCDRGPREKRG